MEFQSWLRRGLVREGRGIGSGVPEGKLRELPGSYLAARPSMFHSPYLAGPYGPGALIRVDDMIGAFSELGPSSPKKLAIGTLYVDVS